MNIQEFMELMEAQVVVAQGKLDERAKKAHEIRAMRTVDLGGITCLASKCLNKAEFMVNGNKEWFCESHLPVGLGA